jgi:glycosyltransferase involved in cell wall biosynthesis
MGLFLTRFSVILPVRNGWPYVQECVESVLTQTYPHLELIVLDNQSADNTVPWLKSQSDSRIRLYHSMAPLSIVDSWARAVGVEKHEYMTLIGHDDRLDPGFLDAIKRLIDRCPDAKLYQTGSRFIDSDGKTIRSCRPVPERETPAQYLEGRFTYQRDITGTGVVMRSADYDRMGGIPHFERLFFADDALWLSLMQGGYKAYDPAELAAVRMHGKKESTTKPSAWRSLLLGLNQFSDFLQGYIQHDREARAAVAGHATAFMLRYHQNLYILALVEACQSGRKIDPAVTEQIAASLAKCAPAAAGALQSSPKVAAIAALNATPFRPVLPHLWEAYHRFWMQAQ